MFPWWTIGSTKIDMYIFWADIATYLLFIFNLLHYREKKEILGFRLQKVQGFFERKMPRFKPLSGMGLWVILEILLISYAQYFLPSNFVAPLANLTGTGANYFGILYTAPLILLLVCFLLRIPPLKQIDLITPAFAMALFFNKVGCFCAGCCAGFECSWGMYNGNGGHVQFPVQLVEAGLALAIFVFLLVWRKKAKPGTMYPLYMILMAGTRFFSEFLREEPNVFLIFKTYHILCFIGVALGVLEWFMVSKYGDKITEFCLHGFEKKKKAIKHSKKRKKK